MNQLIPDDLARRAADAVLHTAERLRDPAHVAAISAAPGNEEPVSGLVPWQSVTLSHGHPGIAVFYGELARRDDNWSPAADAHLRAAVEAMPTSPSDGLYLGPAAIAAAAQACAGDGDRYTTLRGRLIAWVADDQHQRINDDQDRTAAGGRGVAWRSYDVINGLSGTGRLLLDAAASGPAAQAAEEAVHATLRHLVRLREPTHSESLPADLTYPAPVPGWWVPPELEPVDQDKLSYPQGDLNLGMAHGIAGPLTLLSLAAERGMIVPGQLEAVETMADWLTGWTLTDPFGLYWPCRVSLADEIADIRPTQLFTRTAWCYGAPGVALALATAADAMGRDDWRKTAVTGVVDALSRPQQQWRLDGPTLCHGYGGLLAIVLRLAERTRDPALIAALPNLTETVIGYADDSSPFVFAHLTPDSPDGWLNATHHKRLAGAGLSEGAAGVGCALLDLIPPEPGPQSTQRLLPTRDGGWDRCLMLG